MVCRLADVQAMRLAKRHVRNKKHTRECLDVSELCDQSQVEDRQTLVQQVEINFLAAQPNSNRKSQGKGLPDCLATEKDTEL